MNNEENKVCLNCKSVLTPENTTISGAGKSPLLCDVCMSKVMKFLNFVSKSESPAVENFKVNLEKLNRSGLEPDGLRYIYGFCRRLDEKRNAVSKAAGPAEKISGESASEPGAEPEKTAEQTAEHMSAADASGDSVRDGDTENSCQETKIWCVSELSAKADAEKQSENPNERGCLEQIRTGAAENAFAAEPVPENTDSDSEAGLNGNDKPVNREDQRKRLVFASVITAAALIIVIAIVSAVVLFGGKGGKKDAESGSVPSAQSSGVQSLNQADR